MRVMKVAAITVFALVSAFAAQAQSNPLVGTWKLNLDKSKYDPGPAPKSLVRKVEVAGDGVKYTFEGVAADGKPLTYSFTVKFDGKDNPVMGTAPNGADTISATRTDAHHYTATLKKGGKEVGTSKVTVSDDGMTTTVDATGTNLAGVKGHDVQVYDKQ
jgi:hypothetical protein